jgi:hypothetical protein
MLLLALASAAQFSHEELGQDLGGPQLLALNPKVSPQTYASRGDLQGALVQLLEQAKEDDLLDAETVVALPRHIGHWLVVANRGAGVYDSRSAEVASFRVGMATPVRYLSALAQLRDPIASLVAIRGDDAVGIWSRICSRLSGHYGVWLAGGSATDSGGDEVFGVWSPAGERLPDGAVQTAAGTLEVQPMVRLGHESVTATLHGRLWDLPAGEGHAIATLQGQQIESRAQLLSVWLPPSDAVTPIEPPIVPQVREPGPMGSDPLR